MSARVIVQSGISEGTSHWIDRAVIRIGSDPEADVCLPSPNVPAQALTVEYRDGCYRVYNRCPREVLVGRRVVPPNAMADWPGAEILQLDEENRLLLEVDEDPTPQPRPLAPTDDYHGTDHEPSKPAERTLTADSDDPEHASLSPGSSKTLVQLTVVTLCVIGSVLLLLRDRTKTSAPRQRPVFATVVKDALTSTTTSRDLVQRLQHAESAVVRGDKKAARERFMALRDDLINQQDDFESQRRTPELAIIDFVEYRLGQLK